MVRELSVAEGSKYLVVADCVLSSVNVIGSYFRESTSLVETYAPYKVRVEPAKLLLWLKCLCFFSSIAKLNTYRASEEIPLSLYYNSSSSFIYIIGGGGGGGRGGVVQNLAGLKLRFFLVDKKHGGGKPNGVPWT